VKLGKTKAVQFIASDISALSPVRGQWADAGRSVHGLSVDWQAWGTKGGLCWRATRDGLRHVPAGPPKSRALENPLTPLPRDPHKQRLSARRATIPVEYVSQSIQAKTARETAPLNRNPLSGRAPSAGAGKNALFPSRSFSARGALGVGFGVGFGVGVRTTDSHALSNTWESVQKSGQLGNGVVI
jgi:hypothetical protein